MFHSLVEQTGPLAASELIDAAKQVNNTFIAIVDIDYNIFHF